MLQSLTIKNFQNHKKSVLNFSPGLNVIYGDNDQGKSAVLRALNWVIANKPSGFAFQNKQAVKAFTEVSLITDDQSITRRRGEKENCYLVGKDKFTALRSDVPNEVSSLLNLSSFAYQSQFDSHFLFNDSPGEVAKKINQIVGLTEIDDVLSRARGLKDTTNREIGFLTKKKDKLKLTISPLKGIEELEERVELLIKREKILENKIDLSEKTDRMLSDLSEIQDSIDALNSLLFHSDKLAKLEAVHQELSELRKQIKTLSEKITLTIRKSNEIEIYYEARPLLLQIEDLEKKETKLKKMREQKISLNYKIGSLGIYEKKILDAEQKENEWREKIEKEKKRMKVCPLCDKPF